MNKEEIYDKEIYPLMDKIQKICQDNKIDTICTFHIPTEEDDGLMCSTIMFHDGNKTPRRYYQANNIIKEGEHNTFGITIKKVKKEDD